MGIPVGHVEAGLRTYRARSPFPEEFNRQAISVIADLHFAPTELARENLLREGKRAETVVVTGNTVLDALKGTVREDFSHEILEWASGYRLVFVTAHRRESIGEPMRGMFRAIRRILAEYPNVRVVYPVHKNPAVRKIAEEELSSCENLRMTEPFDVITCHNLMARSFLILTDSGGIQEEASSLAKPVLVMRDTTERPEGVRTGSLRLVGTKEEDIFNTFREIAENEDLYRTMSSGVSPYGDGFACKRIADVILK
jgi:UDP-N-acetylglucosamine 2-epimerase (non-hydrolysing)